MKRFVRAECPDFWCEREAAWLARDPDSRTEDPLHDFEHRSRRLAQWFHEFVRPEGHPNNCAYCDGWLRVTSRANIDHFIPRREAPDLGLAWENLFPACNECNSTKLDQWDVFLIRPDRVDESWFDIDLQDGQIRPAPHLDPMSARYVRFTIEILALDTFERRLIRKATLSALRAYWKEPRDDDDIACLVANGPYRMVAELFLASKSVAPF